MENKKYHIVRTVPQCNRKMVEIDSKLVPLTHIYDSSFS